MMLSQLTGQAPAAAHIVSRPAAPATLAAPRQHEIETILGGIGDTQPTGTPKGGARP
jgi:hypothetical protein